MLRLKALEINGFKSFVDPVRAEFAEGLTAIVGPNGCGKSNLSEAITWVLGEQSAKSLRGGKMEDVIFGGTATRRPLGMAEVSLTLHAPQLEQARDGLVTIGRRVFRSGESIYRLNDEVVRLKDIKDMLMDTGLGVRAYSVIEQGKIGQILSGRPQERRRLIEEAAGITRYRQRKRLAELKLEEATANRMRLDDILSEVERALRSLKRQSSAARRFKRRKQEYDALLERVLVARALQLANGLEQLGKELGEREDRDAEMAAKIASADADLHARRHQLDRLTDELSARQQRSAELLARIEGRQQQIKGARETLREVNERLAGGAAAATRRRAELEAQARSLEELDRRRQHLEEECEQARTAFTNSHRLVEAAAAALAAIGEELARRRSVLMSSLGSVNEIQSRLHRNQMETERSAFARERLEQEIATKREEKAELSEEARLADAELERLERDVEERQRELAALRERLDGLLRDEASAGEQRQQIDEEARTLAQRLQLLEELAAEDSARRDHARAALAAAGVADVTFLEDLATPPAGWEASVSLFLSQLEDAVVLPAQKSAAEVAAHLEPSRAIVHLIEPGKSGDDSYARTLRREQRAASLANEAAASTPREPSPPKQRGLFTWLRERLLRTRTAPAAATPAGPRTAAPPARRDDVTARPLGEALGLPAEVAAALPPAYLVDDEETAARLARAHPGVAFLPRTRSYRTTRVLHAGGGGARPNAAARQRELVVLAARRDELTVERTEAAERLERLVAARTELAGELRRGEKQIAELQKQVAIQQARRQDLVHRGQRLDADLDGLAEERSEIEQQEQKLAAQRRQLESELAAGRAAHADLEDGVDTEQAKLDEARELHQARRADDRVHRQRLDLLEERLAAQAAERERLDRQRLAIEEQLAEWREEEQRLRARREELERDIEQAGRELQEASDAREQVEEERRAAQDRVEEQRRLVAAADDTIAALRAERESARRTLEELRIERATRSREIEHLAETYRQEFRRELPLVGLAAPPARPLPLIATRVMAAPATACCRIALTGTEASAPAPRALTTLHDVAAGAITTTLDESAPARAAWLPRARADIAALDGLQTELQQLREQLERMGPVNVLAAEEYAEQEERYGFLTEQREDLNRSIDSLRRTIREINQTSFERFSATFEEVNRNFADVFTELFHGGEASMRLLDEEDPLESGIEIVARPPGKRLQSIQLLSGGEKALTAIALLFALFRAKPSPFCILDEVDAPLDDANVLRFIDMLSRMTQDTQFLVITHNKLTMEAASALYGVTMEERGVSKLVGVDLERIHPAQIAS